MVVLSVDPGKGGCLCVYDGEGLLDLHDTPTYRVAKGSEYDLPEIVSRLFSITKEHGHTHTRPTLRAVIEKVFPHPGEGVVSCKTMGYGEGIWHMAFTVFGIPYETVAPQTWKKAYGLIGAEKKASVAAAKQRFPSASLDRVKDHNRADAILMSLWLWEKKL